MLLRILVFPQIDEINNFTLDLLVECDHSTQLLQDMFLFSNSLVPVQCFIVVEVPIFLGKIFYGVFTTQKITN